MLSKVDARRSRFLKAASDAEFEKVKQERFGNLIFWEFIEAERNVVLKEYKASIFDKVSDLEVPGKEKVVVTDIMVGTDVYSPVDAVAEAVRWWERYLDRVEHSAQTARRSERSVTP